MRMPLGASSTLGLFVAQKARRTVPGAYQPLVAPDPLNGETLSLLGNAQKSVHQLTRRFEVGGMELSHEDH